MKFIIIVLGLIFSMGLFAEVWEKPPYTPDEGHLQEEIERQEERPAPKKVKEDKHQDIKKPVHHHEVKMNDAATPKAP